MNGERQGDLMVSALDSGASSPARALAGDIVLCSWARHCTLTMPLSTQVYRWVPKSCVGVTCDGLASRLGEVEILLDASCHRNRDKLGQLWASLGSKASLYDWCLQCDFTTRRRRNSQNVLWVKCAYKVVVLPKQVIQLCVCLAHSQDSEVGKSSVTKRVIY